MSSHVAMNAAQFSVLKLPPLNSFLKFLTKCFNVGIVSYLQAEAGDRPVSRGQSAPEIRAGAGPATGAGDDEADELVTNAILKARGKTNKSKKPTDTEKRLYSRYQIIAVLLTPLSNYRLSFCDFCHSVRLHSHISSLKPLPNQRDRHNDNHRLFP